jgi:signal transduction histidine kinase
LSLVGIVTATDRTLRVALWLLGALAFAALWAGLVRERHQSEQLAQRTEELERLYEEVARANRMKGEFLANVSHELRTPLNAIVGFAEMLKDGSYGDLSARQAVPVDRIATSTVHLRALVDQLLDIAKIAAGRVDIHVEDIALKPFILDVAAEMESLAAERGLTMTISVGQPVARVQTDSTHLRQILINLIGNAVKYTNTGGVQVRAVLAGSTSTTAPEPLPKFVAALGRNSWLALQVSDTGVGIAAEDRERIFDEFEQVNAGARSDSARRGTGLGLPISRRLARLLGGELTATSEPGRGSTFTVWLPHDAGPLQS